MRAFNIISRRLSLLLVVAGLGLGSSAARAHDSWFELVSLADGVQLALGTGTTYPVREVPIAAEYLDRHGCHRGPQPVPLLPKGLTPNALMMHAAPGDGPLSCWAQTVPMDIVLPADKIKVYLKEINATQAVRDAWASMQARGVPWTERYAKHARIEVPAQQTTEQLATPLPSGMDMDVLIESGLQPTHAGDWLIFRVLRDGQPLPGFAMELRGDRQPIGLWVRTDAEGRVKVRAPLPGHWVLRGTDLHLSMTKPDTWESRFVNLAFEIGPPRRESTPVLP